jgi:hypothetical protein
VREHYEIYVRGSLGPEVAEAFCDLIVSSCTDGTHLAGWLDQAGLHGVLNRIQALGLHLIELRRVDGDSSLGDR